MARMTARLLSYQAMTLLLSDAIDDVGHFFQTHGDPFFHVTMMGR